MGKGRKNRALPVNQKTEVKWARNLPANKLAAVIFGCKNYTIAECFEKMIFGLPAAHFSYVQNITPGLPLFLFNYSDRTLHGVFKAASCGQMNINRYAWITCESAETTLYPAQVRVCEMKKCYPLHEDKFKHIIKNNYYQESHFWFELDKGQYKSLSTLFLSSPFHEEISRPHVLSSQQQEKMPHLPDTALQNNIFNVLTSSCVNETADDSEGCSGTANSASKNWASLFKLKNSKTSEPEEVKLASSFDELSKQPFEPCLGSTSDIGHWEDYPVEEDFKDGTYRTEVKCSQHQDWESDAPDLTYFTSSENRIFQDGEDANLEALDDYVPDEKPTQTSADSGSVFMDYISKLVKDVEWLKVSRLEQLDKIGSLEQELADSNLEINVLKERCHKLETSCSSRGYCTKSFVFVVGGFDGKSWLTNLTSYFPSDDHIVSLCPMTFSRRHASVAKLNGELYIFGGAREGAWCDIVESYNPDSNMWVQRPSLNRRKECMAGASMYGNIFAIGGGNGNECFSEVECFDLSIGSWTYYQPMLEKRFAPAAADMNGAIYVAGGYDGTYYMRSAERYDPRASAWTRLGDMNMNRGCHSLVSYKEKLYAIGGHNGVGMIPSVEVLDPRFGSWTMAPSMNNPRGYFGAFVLGEKMHVIGGEHDGHILDMTECYTEDSGWQTSGARGVGKRSCLLTLVL